ncbi:unnamed protein product [Kuraishia capsulata CBS 1993]|uniref:serine--tRNA ligase n=1 Tax=Kuraishia capsulata CBS 1993 TaxID=1382522 RepID=W6MFI9_9ASCO|nr:uncharacterized protein KUCA_T00000068001 [Kuraishia capsulata CBS 1993]CDK24108.1 unnamed protein product [Kuraishia capsulata CBS 1993]
MKFPLRSTNALSRPVFNFSHIYTNLGALSEITRLRNVKVDLDLFAHNYEKWSELRQSFTELRKLQTAESKQKNEASLAKLRLLKPQLKELKDKISELEDSMLLAAESLPNAISPNVGSEAQLVKTINPDFKLDHSENRDHKAIMERLGLVDFANASRVTGNSWYYLMGDAARLEQALIQYALDKARTYGFKLVSPPSIVKDEISFACGFKPRDQNGETQVYQLPDELSLTGTAEIPIAGLKSNQILTDLPHRICGVSRSFRAEAGARGRDTRGLYRVHEFNKVELFIWCENDLEKSEAEFEKLVQFQMEFVESLGLHAMVLNMPYDDLGAPAYCKYDIECWMPGRNAFGEVTSSSICLDYQATRLSTTYRDSNNKVRFVHTLNGTACAVPRVILAIVENFWDEATDSILVPKVLRPYMGGQERIVKQ